MLGSLSEDISRISKEIEKNPSSLLFYKRSLLYYKQYRIEQSSLDLEQCLTEKYCRDLRERITIEMGFKWWSD